MKCIEYGHLLKVEVYKSEGILFFSLAELEADSLLRESLSISIRRTIAIGRGVIIDKGRRYKAVSYKHKWYCHSGKTLNVYIPYQRMHFSLDVYHFNKKCVDQCENPYSACN